MHIAILITNTDDSDFSRRHPGDFELFANLMSIHRPEWRFTGYDLPNGAFPETLAGFDGVVIAGSPASVNDECPWIGRLMDMIRELDRSRMPMFGACFGHQAVAKALGGVVGFNPGGWQLGLAETTFSTDRPWIDRPGKIGLYAAHKEQVLELPAAAAILSASSHCPVGAFAIGGHVFTTQYHPEMTHEFITALVEELVDDIGPDVTATARNSLSGRAEMARFAQWLVSFFEYAAALRPSAAETASLA